jgi:hypothetical protein
MWHRYTFVRQNDQSDCGAAALATVALHLGQPIARSGPGGGGPDRVASKTAVERREGLTNVPSSRPVAKSS